MEKSKILILTTSYLPLVGGSELAIKNIIERLTDIEFDIVTARAGSDVPEHEKSGNTNIFRVGGFFGLSNFFLPKLLLPLHIFLKARSLVAKNNYKAVHAYQASQAAGAAWMLKSFYPKLTFILTLQEGKELEKQGFLIIFFRGLIIKKADLATAISNFLKGYLLKVRRDLKVTVIPNGVDIKSFSRQFTYGEMTDMDNKLGIMPDDKVIISTSRLVHKNGLDLLIGAIAELKNGKDKYKLILVGDGQDKEKLANLAEELGVSDRVVFAGQVNIDELPLYLKISDVFVRPSRSEGLGNAFLEAMAAGVPVIGTRVGGIPDFLEDRKTGLFSTGEPADIAFKIRIIIENDKIRQELVANGLSLVKERYSWNLIASEFGKLYASLKP